MGVHDRLHVLALLVDAVVEGLTQADQGLALEHLAVEIQQRDVLLAHFLEAAVEGIDVEMPLARNPDRHMPADVGAQAVGGQAVYGLQHLGTQAGFAHGHVSCSVSVRQPQGSCRPGRGNAR
jgi:hypothetical protein